MTDSPRLPTLSVVVPNYNHGRYLEGALLRHVGQTVPPLEVIVIDDASTDDSCAIAERVAARHATVRLVRLPRNVGVNAASNRGLDEARGECICFSAADDVVRPEFASRSLGLLARHPEAAFCFSDAAETAGDSGVVEPLPLRLSEAATFLSPQRIEQLLRRNFFAFPGHTVTYRRDAIRSLGGFDEPLRWHADWFANCVLAFRHGACYVPEVLAVFRVSPQSYWQHGVRQASLQRATVQRFLELLDSPAYRDVRPAFRRSALLPELRARTLWWLLASRRDRRYLTARLGLRLTVRGAWWAVKPYMPKPVRPALRWAARRWAQLTSLDGAA
jgi:glycosyltransferase involved in cell wall biosynthesis